ncbi:unnamed protein product [Rotaria socialis]|uniref:Putative rRNA methyltransferase n=3 Tax=Rotaria socialis TaxID=392032 RepID=A0A818NGN9_9BILA|nr:unnamed protein product [Rotaria socialis]CAF3606419.1 unnamed protein product [Rotaria socialis]CAF4146523.1 unnamed protein product [Rotaria socialis]CAF4463658.1 unnamed protein product [Rotaria socialis]
MGKKAKTGKLRRDKFYHLAKESGFRSRAAFKLLQLNREHRILENARVLIDLCAAPGGWLQVAEKHMPVSSLIIGVDLAPIKPIPHTITYQEDITSEKCRQLLKKDLGTFKADVILHDGAPNVGKSWIHDAYQQNVLTLNALKLATEFLRKGGIFVTKLFRSKDYYSLLWVFQQMFKRVDSTKPQASRNESAEIFVICHGYLAPDKIDPKFLDYKHVFTEIDNDITDVQTKAKQRLKHPEKFIRSREGYPEGDYTLYHKLEATKFIQTENFLELLAMANEITIDDERILEHPQTTAEIKECIKDIKVLGRREITLILAWRRHLAASLFKKALPIVEQQPDETKKVETTENDREGEKDDEEDDMDKDIEEQLLKLSEQQRKEAKRKRKHIMKEKRKLRDRLALKMVLPGDIHDHETAEGGKNDQGLFDLEKIKTRKQLLEISSAIPDMDLGIDQVVRDDDDVYLGQDKNRIPRVAYDKDKNNGDLSSIDIYKQYLEDDDENDEDELMPYDSEHRQVKLDSDVDDNESDNDDYNNDEWEDDEENPLDMDIIDASTKSAKAKTVADVWFEQDIFKQTLQEDNDDEEFELERKLSALHSDGVPVLGKPSKSILKTKKDNDSSESEDDAKPKKSKRPLNDNEFEEVPIDQPMKRIHLDADDLALGHVIAQSRRNREQVLDHSYNRFMGYGDIDGLPKWFIEEEKQHCRASLPVTKELVERYKAKMREIDQRPTKKVAEAKGRKKRRELRKLDKVKKKAEPLLENPDLDDKERNKQIKDLYRKYGVIGQKKPDIKYVVAKKSTGGGARPSGAKGPYKVVDKRLKKDKRAAKSRGKANKNKQSNRKGHKQQKGAKTNNRKKRS